MSEADRRRQLRAEYKQSQPEAGVYRLINSGNNRSLLGYTTNLPSMRSKLEFARTTNTPSALDQRLREDIRRFGIEAFSLEVLEVLDVRPGMTAAEIGRDLATLEQLWREKLDPALLY